MNNHLFGIKFKNSNLNIDSSFTLNNNNYPKQAICNSKGDLQLLHVDASISHITDNKGNAIINSQLMVSPNNSYFLNFPDNRYVFLYSYDSGGISETKDDLNNKLRQNDGLHLVKIEKNPSGYSVVKSDGKFFTGNVRHFSLARRDDSSFIAICNTTQYLYALLIQWDKTIVLDSLKLERFKMLPDSIKNNPKVILKFYSGAYLSHDCSNIIISELDKAFLGISTGGLYSATTFGLGSMTLINIELDRNTGKFGNSKLIDQYTLDYKQAYDMGDCDIVFATNSNHFFKYELTDKINDNYIIHEIWRYKIKNSDLSYDKKNIYQLRSLRGSTDTFKYICGLPKINPSGDIIFANQITTYSNPVSSQVNYCKIINSTSPFSTVTENIKSISLNNIRKGISVYFYTKNIYDFLKIDLNSKPENCQAKVEFINLSDTNAHFQRYTYILQNENGGFDTFVTKDLTLYYKRNGTYFYKILAESLDGYSEFYTDSIHINLINYPKIISFQYPRIVCRYSLFNIDSKVNFNSTLNSNSKTYFIENWSKSQTPPFYALQHYFPDTGKYYLKLVVSNSFCQDTLKDTILVIDAPRPGFSVNYNKGCSPLEVTINDSNAEHYHSKLYWFSDINQWITIDSGIREFKYVFRKKGNFEIVQRLNGISCATQRDTANIKVFDGYSDNDSIYLKSITFINNRWIEGKNNTCDQIDNAIQLNWKGSEKAIQYEVFINGKYYVSTRDTQITVYLKYDTTFYFNVRGIDTCNKSSNLSKFSKPVFLDIKANYSSNFAVGSFTPIVLLNDSKLYYTFQKYINGIWTDINNLRNAFDLLDPAFMLNDQLNTSYRIKIQSYIDSDFISYSNISCVPYQPIIFIPNAFSPNLDNINETFKPIGFGLKWYKLTIMNQWGEIIFKGEKNEPWSGTGYQNGVYVCLVEFETDAGRVGNISSTIHLLK